MTFTPLEDPDSQQAQQQATTTTSSFRSSLRETLGVTDKKRKPEDAAPAVVGHRGAPFVALENTREGFLQCVAWGCQSVELDAYALADGTVVVFHGGGTDQHPGLLQGYCVNHDTRTVIMEYTYAETQNLIFNATYEEFPCPPEVIAAGKIPTLEQVLMDLKSSGTDLKIEIKSAGAVEPILALVERLEMQSQCSYSSFTHKYLAELRQLRPDKTMYPTGALFCDLPHDYLAQAHACGATEVHLRYDACTFDRIQDIHAQGFKSMAWFRGPAGMLWETTHRFGDVGNEDEACYEAILDTGVQQICCNRPNVILDMLKRDGALSADHAVDVVV